MTVVGIDHVQLVMPSGREDDARAFYSGILDIPEIPKPSERAARGGAWFQNNRVKIHVGVDPSFHPARKAHPALLIRELPTLLDKLRSAGYEVRQIDGSDSVYVHDPFGNRIELVPA